MFYSPKAICLRVNRFVIRGIFGFKTVIFLVLFEWIFILPRRVLRTYEFSFLLSLLFIMRLLSSVMISVLIIALIVFNIRHLCGVHFRFVGRAITGVMSFLSAGKASYLVR